MPKYEIWAEGYAATGDRGTAHYFGTVEASSFAEACKKLAEVNVRFARNFSPERMSHWGCRLFDNEKDARKSFG